MKKVLFLMLILLIQSCSSQYKHFIFDDNVPDFPEIEEKLNIDLNRCLNHFENKKLQISLSTKEKRNTYCTCMILGFANIHQFKPISESSEEYFKQEAEHNKDYASFYYKAFTTQEQEFNKYDAALNSSSLSKKHYDDFNSKYEKKINFCFQNADFGILTFIF